jgi:hypothetical protein
MTPAVPAPITLTLGGRAARLNHRPRRMAHVGLVAALVGGRCGLGGFLHAATVHLPSRVLQAETIDTGISLPRPAARATLRPWNQPRRLPPPPVK